MFLQKVPTDLNVPICASKFAKNSALPAVIGPEQHLQAILRQSKYGPVNHKAISPRQREPLSIQAQ
jgi:hypothetical protein